MHAQPDHELAALLGTRTYDAPLQHHHHRHEPRNDFDVLPRLHHHEVTTPLLLSQPFKLEPDITIEVRDGTRLFNLYHKLDERWRANLTQQALGAAHSKDDFVSSAIFVAEERFLHFAKRLNISFNNIAELKSLNDKQMREVLQIGNNHEPPFVTELKEMCEAMVSALDELASDEDSVEARGAWTPSYFKDCLIGFSKQLTACVEALDDVVHAAYSMKVMHIAQLTTLGMRYHDAILSAGAIARASHHSSLQGWAKGVVEVLMAWADRLSPLVTALRGHIMRLAEFVQGTINILQYHQMHVAQEEARGVAPQVSGALSLETLSHSLQHWRGFMGAINELAKLINNRDVVIAGGGGGGDAEDALQSALLQNNPNPSESCKEAFLSMRFFLSNGGQGGGGGVGGGSSLVQPVKALTDRIAAAAKDLNPALAQYKRETEKLFHRYNAETVKQEKLVADLDKTMRTYVEESAYHSGESSRLHLFQQGNVEFNIKLMAQIEALKPVLAREQATLRDLRDSFGIMAELHKSCQDKLPFAQFDKMQAAELSLINELKEVAFHVVVGHRTVNGQAFASAKAASASLFESAGQDYKTLATQRDKVFETEVLHSLQLRLNFALPRLKDLQTHILQLCRHFNGDFINHQLTLAEVNLDTQVINYNAMRLNLIIAMHIHEYAVEIARERSSNGV